MAKGGKGGMVTTTPGEADTTGYLTEEEGGGVAGILASILGLGGSIAGAIPTFTRKPPVDIRGGQAAARQAGRAASEAAVGAASAGHGRTRGLALREGLRSAERQSQQGIRQAAIAGERASLAEAQLRTQLQQDRLNTALRLGTGLGGALGTMGTTIASSQDQGPAAQTPATAPQSPVEAAPAQTGTQVPVTSQPPQTAPQAAPGATPVTREPSGAFPGAENKGFTPGGTPFQAAAPAVSPADTIQQSAQEIATQTQRLAEITQPDTAPLTTPGDPSIGARSVDQMYHQLMAEVSAGKRSPEEAEALYAEFVAYQEAQYNTSLPVPRTLAERTFLMGQVR